MDKSEVKFLCYFAYLGPFWLIGLIGGGRASKSFCFHANQGIGLFICELITVPVIALLGYLLGGAAATAATIAAVAVFAWLSVKGLLNVSNGRRDDITFLGRYNFLPVDDGRQ